MDSRVSERLLSHQPHQWVPAHNATFLEMPKTVPHTQTHSMHFLYPFHNVIQPSKSVREQCTM